MRHKENILLSIGTPDETDGLFVHFTHNYFSPRKNVQNPFVLPNVNGNLLLLRKNIKAENQSS